MLKVNPFVPNVPFLYPLKTSENRKVETGALGTNGLIKKIPGKHHKHLSVVSEANLGPYQTSMIEFVRLLTVNYFSEKFSS